MPALPPQQDWPPRKEAVAARDTYDVVAQWQTNGQPGKPVTALHMDRDLDSHTDCMSRTGPKRGL